MSSRAATTFPEGSSDSSHSSASDAEIRVTKTIGRIPRVALLPATLFLLVSVAALACACVFLGKYFIFFVFPTARLFARVVCEVTVRRFEGIVYRDAVFVSLCVKARLADLAFSVVGLSVWPNRLWACSSIFCATELLLGVCKQHAAYALAWRPYAERARVDLLAQHVILMLTSHVTGRVRSHATHQSAALRLVTDARLESMYACCKSTDALPANDLYESDAFRSNTKQTKTCYSTFDRSRRVSMRAPDSDERVSAKVFGENLFDMLVLQHAVSASPENPNVVDDALLEAALGERLGLEFLEAPTRTLSKRDFARIIVDRCRKHVDLASSLQDYERIVVSLMRILRVLAYFLLVLVFARIYGSAEAQNTLTWASLLFAFGFVFSGATNNLSDCCLFVFVTRPFDVGDRISIDEDYLTVYSIGILSTTCGRDDGISATYPNQMLAQCALRNETRRHDAVHKRLVAVPWDTLDAAKQRILKNLNEEARRSSFQWGRDSASVALVDVVDDVCTLQVSLTQADTRPTSVLRGREAFERAIHGT